jgi:hypothetical protein
VIWETWATDDFTFPKNPQTVPVWSHRMFQPEKTLHPDPLIALFDSSRIQILGGKNQGLEESGEEVRRNYNAFQSITTRALWYQEGLAQWAKNHPEPLLFHRGSVEIKAVWIRAFPSDKSDYHWNYANDGIKYKLVALHIMTNALPEWTWATWEWADNPGRCNYINCVDHFGTKPSCILSQNQAAAYPPGKLSYGVKKMFSKLGVNSEWKGYRLKGSQVFKEGRASRVKLGNTKMENDFMDTSSCIACHARARVFPNGKADCSLGFANLHPLTGYLDYPPNDAIAPYTTGFIWAFLRASSKKPGENQCGP